MAWPVWLENYSISLRFRGAWTLPGTSELATRYDWCIRRCTEKANQPGRPPEETSSMTLLAQTAEVQVRTSSAGKVVFLWFIYPPLTAHKRHDTHKTFLNPATHIHTETIPIHTHTHIPSDRLRQRHPIFLSDPWIMPDKKRLTTTPNRIRKWSPTLLLTGRYPAYLRRSDGMRSFLDSMVVDEKGRSGTHMY